MNPDTHVLQIAVVAADHQADRRPHLIQQASQEAIQRLQQDQGLLDVLAVADEVGQETLVENQVMHVGQPGQALPGQLRLYDGHGNFQILIQEAVGDVPVNSLATLQVSHQAKRQPGGQHGKGGGRMAAFALFDKLEVRWGVGIGEGGSIAALRGPLEDVVLVDELGQGAVGIGGQVVAQELGRVHPGEKGRLAGGALGEPFHPQTGINAFQQQTQPLYGAPINQRSTQQLAQVRHGSQPEGVAVPGWPQPHAVQKDKDHLGRHGSIIAPLGARDKIVALRDQEVKEV